MDDLLKRLDDAAPYARDYGFAARCVEAAARIRELEAQLAAQSPAEVWRRAMDAAAQAADEWLYDPENNVVADTLFSALPLPDDLR